MRAFLLAVAVVVGVQLLIIRANNRRYTARKQLEEFVKKKPWLN
jgi:hypothetical protein